MDPESPIGGYSSGLGFGPFVLAPDGAWNQRPDQGVENPDLGGGSRVGVGGTGSGWVVLGGVGGSWVRVRVGGGS